MSVMVTMGVVKMPLVSTFMVDISVSVKQATMVVEEFVLVSAMCSKCTLLFMHLLYIPNVYP